MKISDIQHQIIIGCVFGGCSLNKQPKGKNYYLSMRSKDILWLRYKIEELNCFDMSEITKQNFITHACNTQCAEVLTGYHRLLYKNGRRNVTQDILEELKDIGLAIWFIESGGWGGRNRKNAYINTTLLSDESSELIKNYFNSLNGIQCSINATKDRKKILFSVKGTEKILKIILPKFPPFMIKRIENGESLH